MYRCEINAKRFGGMVLQPFTLESQPNESVNFFCTCQLQKKTIFPHMTTYRSELSSLTFCLTYKKKKTKNNKNKKKKKRRKNPKNNNMYLIDKQETKHVLSLFISFQNSKLNKFNS
jgi:hypothetical protein